MVDKLISDHNENNTNDENRITDIGEEKEMKDIEEFEIIDEDISENEIAEKEFALMEQEFEQSISQSIDNYLDSFFPEEWGRAEKIIKEWIDLFSKFSFHNELYAHQCLHLFLGHLLKDKYFYLEKKPEDLRYNFFLIQPSGSGKSAALDFLLTMAKLLDIELVTLTQVTTAGLIGSLQKLQNSSRLNVVYIPGYLNTDDTDGKGRIIWFDEANIFLTSERNEYTKDLFEIVETSLNSLASPSCCIVRKTALGVIRFRPKCSFAFTTYPVYDKTMIEVLKKGIFQRAIPNYKKLSDEEWSELTNDIIKAILFSNAAEKSHVRNQEFTELFTRMQELCNNIKQAVSFGLSRDIKMISEGIPEDILKQFVNEMDEISKGLPSNFQDIFQTFKTRAIREVVKLAIHHSILDNRDVVYGIDFDYGCNIMKKILRNFLEMIQNIEEFAAKDDIYMIYWNKFKSNWSLILNKIEKNEHGYVGSEMKKALASYFKLSESRIKAILKEWALRQLIREKEVDNVKYINF